MNKIGKLLLLGVFVLTFGFGLVGCGGGSTTDNKTATTNKSATENKTTTETKTETKNDATVATSESIGVPECDEYIKKYEACVKGKVPEASRAQFNNSLEQMRKSWKDLAANPTTKGSLANACKQAHEAAKTSMASFSCEW